MTHRLNPLINLLTADNQYEYKSKKSTMDIIPLVNSQIEQGKTIQTILLGFPKAFGDIERRTVGETLRS